MTVRINYAMGRGDRAAVNKLFNAGVVFGLVSGLFAATVATLLAYVPSTLEMLVFPVTFSGCPLFGDPSAVAATTLHAEFGRRGPE